MSTTNWVSMMNDLGADFATRAAKHDEEGSFVAENYEALKKHRVFAAGVPTELGGEGASGRELAEMIRALGRHCSSTALALSMHTHLVATQSYVYRSGNKAPEGLLRRVGAEQIVLVSTGASDWLSGSGTLVKVDGGFRLTGRKIFGSGVPAGDVLMTTGVYDDPTAGPTVIHFGLPIKSDCVKVLDTWNTLAMRGTGSHDIVIENAFVPEATCGIRRPVGKWHPAMHAVVLVALPIVYGAYVGAAEAARDLAIKLAAKKKNDALVQLLVGEMENEIVGAQIAFDSMNALVTSEKPGPATTTAVGCRRALLVGSVLRAADKAMEVAGGSSLYRTAGLERLFRDLQGARYHPIQAKPQVALTGRHLLGLELD
jgi:alkylation response protein AidB-like acyl-CoA dehydrogenase